MRDSSTIAVFPESLFIPPGEEGLLGSLPQSLPVSDFYQQEHFYQGRSMFISQYLESLEIA